MKKMELTGTEEMMRASPNSRRQLHLLAAKKVRICNFDHVKNGLFLATQPVVEL